MSQKKSFIQNILTSLVWRKLSAQQQIIILSIVVALIAGTAAVIMKNSVHFIDHHLSFFSGQWTWLQIIFPAIGFVLVYIVAKLILKIETGHGIPGILFAISRRNARIGKDKTYSSLITSIITVGFGGSVGLEGPSASTGAAIGSNLGKKFNLSYKQKIIMIGCGATAAISAIFNTPIAAVIFSLEVLMLDLTISSIIPLLIASVSALILSYFLLGQDTIWLADFASGFEASQTHWYIFLGLFSSLVSVLFTKVYLGSEHLFEKLKKPMLRILIGSILLGFTIYIFPSLYGEGYGIINKCIHNDFSFITESPLITSADSTFWVISILSLIVIFKVIACNLTFGSGGVGGIFAPSLFAGAVSGLMFGIALQAMGFATPPPAMLALVAMAGVMSGVLHGPLTAIFMIAELTKGYELIVPIIITSVISFLISRLFSPNSVYTMQLAKRNELLTHDKNKSILAMMKIERLLETDFYVLKEYYTLGDIVRGIEKSPRNVFPVINNENELIGILTLNNIRHFMFKQELWEELSVKDLMYDPKVKVELDDQVENIANLIHDSGHFNIPVLHKKKYMGFISKANLFAVYQKILTELSE